MESKDMTKKTYEVTYVALDEDLSSLEPVFRKHGAEARNEENRTTKVRLEFPIKKQEYGFFGVLVLEIAPDRVSPLETDLRLSDKLLRFMITAYQPPRKEPERKPVGSLGVEPERRSPFGSERQERRGSEKSAKKEEILDENGDEDEDVLRGLETVVSSSLTNEDLERKIEEILQ